MRAALAGRAVLLLVALAVVALGVHSLWALDLREDAEARFGSLGARPAPAAVAALGADLRRASRLNADPAPELDRAGLLLRLGRARTATKVLEPVVRDNPGSIRGIVLLATATAAFDDARSTAASGKLLELYGHIPDLSLAAGSLRAPDGRRFLVRPGRVQGSVDVSAVQGARLRLEGYAASLTARRPASLVLLVSHGRLLATSRPRFGRPDLVPRYGPGVSRSGFRIFVPLADLRRNGRIDVHLFGALGDGATPLIFNCAAARQDVGC